MSIEGSLLVRCLAVVSAGLVATFALIGCAPPPPETGSDDQNENGGPPPPTQSTPLEELRERILSAQRLLLSEPEKERDNVDALTDAILEVHERLPTDEAVALVQRQLASAIESPEDMERLADAAMHLTEWSLELPGADDELDGNPRSAAKHTTELPVVLFVNGVNTSPGDFTNGVAALRSALTGTPAGASPIGGVYDWGSADGFCLFLRVLWFLPEPLRSVVEAFCRLFGLVYDLAEATIQTLETWGLWFPPPPHVNRLVDVVQQNIDDRRDVILVAHSQGNLSVQQALDRVLALKASNRCHVRVVSVASPINVVPTDIIRLVQINPDVITLVPGAPSGNMPPSLPDSYNPTAHHSFESSYLKEGSTTRTAIVQAVVEWASDLTEDTTSGQSDPIPDCAVRAGVFTAALRHVPPPARTPVWFTLSGFFFARDEDRPDDPSFTTEQIGECNIMTRKGEPLPGSPLIPLDGGEPATASISGAIVELRMDDPFRPGGYAVDPAARPLLDRGFDAGTTIVFDFPGGTDVSAFSASVDVPAEFEVLAPDLNEFVPYEYGSDFEVEWPPGVTEMQSDDVLAAVLIFIMAVDETFTDSVTIACAPEDTGSFAVPATIMTRLRDIRLNSAFHIIIMLRNTKKVLVRLADDGIGFVDFEGSFVFSGSGGPS